MQHLTELGWILLQYTVQSKANPVHREKLFFDPVLQTACIFLRGESKTLFLKHIFMRTSCTCRWKQGRSQPWVWDAYGLCRYREVDGIILHQDTALYKQHSRDLYALRLAVMWTALNDATASSVRINTFCFLLCMGNLFQRYILQIMLIRERILM